MKRIYRYKKLIGHAYEKVFLFINKETGKEYYRHISGNHPDDYLVKATIGREFIVFKGYNNKGIAKVTSLLKIFKVFELETVEEIGKAKLSILL